jgi:hypothetical protein
VALIAVQNDRPNIVVVTAAEAFGAETGAAIDTYDKILGFDEDDEEDRGDPPLW